MLDGASFTQIIQAGNADVVAGVARLVSLDATARILIVPSDVGGEDVARWTAGCPEVKVVVIVGSDHETEPAAALFPADGFLLEREVTGGSLVTALRDVAGGDSPMPAALARRILARSGTPDLARRPILTGREHDVLRLLVAGLSNKQIASRLAVSFHTARRYVANVLAKLNCGNRTEAVVRAIREGIVECSAGDGLPPAGPTPTDPTPTERRNAWARPRPRSSQP